MKPKTKIMVCFGLFWFVSLFRTYTETTETNRTVLKPTETTLNFLKNTKICSQTVSVGLLFVSVQSKHWNSNNPKFCEKIPKYAIFHTVSVALLFVSVQSNTETLCFGIEPKQWKQMFCFEQCWIQFRFEFQLFWIKTSFGSSFCCFKLKLVSKDTLT